MHTALVAERDDIERVLENPFVGARGAWRAAAERVLLLPRATNRERLDAQAERSQLARWVAAVVATGRPLSEELGRRVERGAWAQSRAAWLRLVSAAQRCYRELDALAGESPSLQAVRAAAWSASFGASLGTTLRLERVIREHDVLITGETGTGKEAVAHAIARGTLGEAEAAAPFAALNVAAIPETLIESELFGHVRGAFTGAAKTRAGHVRSVASGCLFLDEVGDLPPTAQSKLLRVMETDKVTPVGSEASYDADVRYIAATHKDLREMVERGGFREDLYERLAGNVIHLPALRERPEDLLAIGLRFCERYLNRDAPEWKAVSRFLESGEARAHRWPGNVRELQNCLRNVLLGLDPGVPLPLAAGTPRLAPAGASPPAEVLEGRASLRSVEDWYLDWVLTRSDKNYALAARILGVDRSTVARKARALARRS